jgi:hypothetical protein
LPSILHLSEPPQYVRRVTGAPIVDDAPPPPPRLVLAGVVAFVVMLGMWIALVGEWDVQDVITGACADAAAITFGWFVSRGGRALPALHREDLAELARIVPRTVVETGRVFAAAARRAAGGGQGGVMITVQTGPGAPGWRGARRAGVLGALLSVTPNSYVVDLEPETGRATVHELVPSRGGSASG